MKVYFTSNLNFIVPHFLDIDALDILISYTLICAVQLIIRSQLGKNIAVILTTGLTEKLEVRLKSYIVNIIFSHTLTPPMGSGVE